MTGAPAGGFCAGAVTWLPGAAGVVSIYSEAGAALSVTWLTAAMGGTPLIFQFLVVETGTECGSMVSEAMQP